LEEHVPEEIPKMNLVVFSKVKVEMDGDAGITLNGIPG